MLKGEIEKLNLKNVSITVRFKRATMAICSMFTKDPEKWNLIIKDSFITEWVRNYSRNML